MNRTAIEWCLNPDGSPGFTWNIITGCLGPKGDGVCCNYCFARKLANGRLRRQYLANRLIAPINTDEPLTLPEAARLQSGLDNPFYPRFWRERLPEPYSVMRVTKRGYQYWGQKPKGIFVCDMGELFGDWIPQAWQAQIFQAFADNRQHRFYLLTKQPQNLIKFSPFPSNCWVGVSATNSDQYKLALWYLNRIDAIIKYISFEPLLEGIVMTPPLEIDWAIIGAQTKPFAPPMLEWVEDLVYLLDRYRIPVFQKDNLARLLGNNLRQEIPKEGSEK